MPRPLFHEWRLPVQRRARRAGEALATGQGFRGGAGSRGRAGAVAVPAGSTSPETLLLKTMLIHRIHLEQAVVLHHTY